MASYIESLDSVIQSLENVGCGSETVAQFMELGMERDGQDQLKLLEQHRKRLLKKVHKNEKRVNCLDYPVLQMNREKKGKQREYRKVKQEERYKNMEKMFGMGDRENMKNINQEFLTGERALFQGKDLRIHDTTFADGESPLKEGNNIELYRSMFKWEYPLWYSRNIKLEDCMVFEVGRAGIQYTENISMKNYIVEAPKDFRRTNGIELGRVTMPNAAKTLWNYDQIWVNQVSTKGDYFVMNNNNLYTDGFELIGNYSFDGAKHGEIHHVGLLSKDAFRNNENVTVYNSFTSGECLGWSAKDLTFIDCTIESNQSMCYIDNLVMKNCRLLNTTLAFGCSTADVEVINTVSNTLNPKSGITRAEKIEELIMDASKVDVTKTLIQPKELGEAVQDALQLWQVDRAEGNQLHEMGCLGGGASHVDGGYGF